MREWRRIQKRRTLGEFLQRLECQRTANEVGNVTRMMLSSMGGINGFTSVFCDLWHGAKRTRDGRRLLTRIFGAYFNLAVASDALTKQAKKTPASDFYSEAELQHEIHALLANAVERSAHIQEKDDDA
jgi:hypothetical protein